MIDEELFEAEEKMDKAVSVAREDFGAIRTGRAHPSMFHKITVFDLILPRVLCGEKITRQDMARLGHGGLCRQCKTCNYPICGFGK